MENINNWFSIVSFIASIASLVLAIVAIWIAFYFKGEADKVSEKVSSLLLEIKSDAKSISQVAMPELKAYGDSMRRFILKGESINEENGNDAGVISKLDEIDKKIKSLSKENDISKLKSQLNQVSNEIAKSEASVAKKLLKKSSGDRSGVRINFGSSASVETSTPNESWQFLLKTAMNWGSNDFKREEYGEKWILIDKNTGEMLPKQHVIDEEATFEDANLVTGDDLSFITL